MVHCDQVIHGHISALLNSSREEYKVLEVKIVTGKGRTVTQHEIVLQKKNKQVGHRQHRHKQHKEYRPEVLAITEVPGRGMTHQLASLWLLNDRVPPEFFRHAWHHTHLPQLPPDVGVQLFIERLELHEQVAQVIAEGGRLVRVNPHLTHVLKI
ncbi:hypothetical protein E2C01_029459 [Portunus trituberculatus]|uniref:Uncharacterized protein n=1 Tax=Portunus trituberculatus TaxID=210409 RepID=A0A5B7ERY1_PORTR|nr:hypothetical protein [Portunus trituberculatus]